MNTRTITHQEPTAPARRGTQGQVLLRAGALEALRLIRHPVHITGWVLYAFALWGNVFAQCGFGSCMNWYQDQFTSLPRDMILFVGVPTFAAASLLATRPRRAGTAEWLSSLPTRAETRWAISLIAAVGPFMVSVLATGVLWCWVWTHDPGLAPRLPSFSEYAVAPVAVLGAGLLAVLIARWFPWPLVPGVVMVGIMTAVYVADFLQLYQYKPIAWFGPYTNVLLSGLGPRPHRGYPGFFPGSMPWHLTYLLGLNLLITTGVFLVGRYRWYAAAAFIPLLGLVVLAGVLQLR